MHTPIVLQYQWLCSVLRGHFVYFGLPSHFESGTQSPQPAAVLMGAIVRLLERLPLPTPSITHPRGWSLANSRKPREEPSAGKPPARICEGEAEWLNYSTTIRRGLGGRSSESHVFDGDTQPGRAGKRTIRCQKQGFTKPGSGDVKCIIRAYIVAQRPRFAK